MSDIALKFPPWISFAFFGLQYWYFFASAALALSAIGWFGRVLPMALRYAAWAGVAACAMPFALALVLIVADRFGPALRAAHERARHRALATSETVGSLLLPAGAVLEFTDETQRVFSAVTLPRPMVVAGIELEGRLEPIKGTEWAGTLARDQLIGDWPCRAGPLWFTAGGVVTRCTLAAAHRLAGYDLPAGADCVRNLATGGWEFQRPQDGPALPIPTLSADLPPGGSLVLAGDGALRRLYVRHEARMTIAGVALYDHIILSGGTELTAELAEPTQVAGATLDADQVVRLDLTTGKIEPATRSSVIEP
jgi:hypothetical protein